MTVIQDLFKQISQNERSQQLLHQRLVPTIVSIFNAPCDKIPTGKINFKCLNLYKYKLFKCFHFH